MSEPTGKPKSSSLAIAGAVTGGFLLVMYFVFPGIVIGLLAKAVGEDNARAMRPAFAPIIWIAEKAPVIESFYSAQLKLFGLR